MRLAFTLLLNLMLILSATAVHAQQKLLRDPELYERQHFEKRCESVKYGADFISRIDINNDGITDMVVNEGSIICDGDPGPDCSEEGCPYNFYLQVKEGGYFMIATAQMYGYDFIKRFGNMVFVLKMHPKFCDRTDSKPCEMTVRVKGTKFLTISKK
ncbi:hypothetical protein ACQQ2Q_07200 [Agrobacterium sp. ES01]|uniref:hypothetical protein n=1 Tax=Agrobacterium sp. ES01 TaxID=3420714 RepID=UPI003D0CF4E7